MKTLQCCKLNFLQWRQEPKYALCFCYLAISMASLILPLNDYSRDLGHPLHPWLYAFLPCSSHKFMILMMAYTLLIMDAPFRNQQQRFVLLRVGKQSWIQGQLLYSFCSSLIFATLLWVLSWLLVLPNLEWSSDWGVAIKTAAKYGSSGGYSLLGFDYAAMKDVTPMKAVAWIFIMLTLVCFLLAEIMTLCNLWLRKGVGVAVVSGMIILAHFIQFSFLSSRLRRLLIWVSPVSWIDRRLMGKVNQELPSFGYAVAMTVGLCLLLGAVIVSTIHRCNLETDKE